MQNKCETLNEMSFLETEYSGFFKIPELRCLKFCCLKNFPREEVKKWGINRQKREEEKK